MVGIKVERVSNMSYNDDMNATIRNIDDGLYKSLKAQAASEGRAIGEVLNDAIREYLFTRKVRRRKGRVKPGFLDLEPVDFGPGNEHLSEEIDQILYGRKT